MFEVIFFGLLPRFDEDPNLKYCDLDPQGDYDDDLKWKKILGIMSHIVGCKPLDWFDDPNWMDTIMFNAEILLDHWNNVYLPALKGGMR